MQKISSPCGVRTSTNDHPALKGGAIIFRAYGACAFRFAIFFRRKTPDVFTILPDTIFDGLAVPNERQSDSADSSPRAVATSSQ